MRQIISKEESERKKKRNIAVLSVIMLAIMVIGTAGYAFLTNSGYGDETQTKQNGILEIGNSYVAKFNGETLYFSNSLESTENISVLTSATLNSFAGLPLYVYSDNDAVKQEIAINLGRYAVRTQEACYGPCEKDLPEKNCTENLIVWKDSTKNKVYQEEKCIFIEGDMKAVDAFLYKMFGFKQ